MQRYFVTTSLIGLAHAWNQPWISRLLVSSLFGELFAGRSLTRCVKLLFGRVEPPCGLDTFTNNSKYNFIGVEKRAVVDPVIYLLCVSSFFHGAKTVENTGWSIGCTLTICVCCLAISQKIKFVVFYHSTGIGRLKWCTEFIWEIHEKGVAYR